MSTATKSILYVTAILPKAQQEALTHINEIMCTAFKNS